MTLLNLFTTIPIPLIQSHSIMLSSSKVFLIVAFLFAIIQIALSQGSKDPPNTNWQPPMDDGDFAKGTIRIPGANPHCGTNNTDTHHQCFKSDSTISVTNKTENINIIKCDYQNRCSMKFNFKTKGNFAHFRVNCLNLVGKPTGSYVDVDLFGKKVVLPYGIVYGSYKIHGENITANWEQENQTNVKRFTDVSV